MRDVNFFSHYIGRKKQAKNSKTYIYGAVTLALSVIAVTFGINTAKLLMLERSIQGYNDKLTASETKTKFMEAENINKQMDILKQYDTSLSEISKATRYRDNVSEKMLNDINSTFPSQISLKNLDVVENTIIMKGTSTDRVGVAELQHNLSKLSEVTVVYVSSINTQNAVEGEYSFDIKCVLKEVE